MSADKKVPYRASGYADVTVCLSIRNCLSAIEFYKRALNAKELMVMKADLGAGEKCMHAELQIGDSRIMMSDDLGSEEGQKSEAAPTACEKANETEKEKTEKPSSDEESESNPYVRNPLFSGTTSTSFVVYVKNVDEAFEHAVKEGAKPVRKPKDQFYGDRSALVRDPFGHVWCLQTHIEDVSPEEMKKRMAAFSGPGAEAEGPAEKKQRTEKKEDSEAEK